MIGHLWVCGFPFSPPCSSSPAAAGRRRRDGLAGDHREHDRRSRVGCVPAASDMMACPAACDLADGRLVQRRMVQSVAHRTGGCRRRADGPGYEDEGDAVTFATTGQFGGEAIFAADELAKEHTTLRDVAEADGIDAADPAMAEARLRRRLAGLLDQVVQPGDRVDRDRVAATDADERRSVFGHPSQRRRVLRAADGERRPAALEPWLRRDRVARDQEAAFGPVEAEMAGRVPRQVQHLQRPAWSPSSSLVDRARRAAADSGRSRPGTGRS